MGKLIIVVGSRVFRPHRPSQLGTVVEALSGEVRVAWDDDLDAPPQHLLYRDLEVARNFSWKRWSGAADSIDGVSEVEFGAAHVVFYGPDAQILRAVRIEQANELIETTRRG